MKYDQRIDNYLTISGQYLIGRETEVFLVLLGILSQGHILIEDQPGMGKTVLASLNAKLLGRPITRIQFTNDLLPSDILGGPHWVKDENAFMFQKGPIFSEMILADELNRASPKTQSALLQAMEEKSVSLDGKTYDLSDKFCVVATQNPYEQVGTNPLPESQLDRFSLGITLDIPSRELEKKILIMEDPRSSIDQINQCLTDTDCKEFTAKSRDVIVSDQLLNYVMDIMTALRQKGAHISPRSGQDLMSTSKMMAAFLNRSHCTPDDIQYLAPYVFGHRVAGARGMKIGQLEVSKLIGELPIP